MIKSQLAALKTLGFEVLPSKSKPGLFRWWLNSGGDGLSVTPKESSETFESEELAWVDVQHTQPVVDLSEWDLVSDGWWYRVVGDSEVHLKADGDLGWEVSLQRNGDQPATPFYDHDFVVAVSEAIRSYESLEEPQSKHAEHKPG